MTVRVITAPAYEPVTLNECKLNMFGSTTFTADDALISALIKVARQYAENYTRRAFVQRTLELTLPYWPSGGIIELPLPPLQSITHIKYIDTAGATQTVDSADYQVDTYRAPGLVKPVYNETWNATRDDFNAVQVRYVAGYATGSPDDQSSAAENIPDSIKHWIKVRVATLYEHREAVYAGAGASAIPRDFVDGLLDPYVVSSF